MNERLDKILASQGLGSRKEAARMLREGRVTVDGQVVRDGALKADPDGCVIAVDGQRLIFRKYLYILMNKPAGVLSATEDSRQRTVLDLLPEELNRRGLFPAGRLDKDTTGLLIITDDGDFAHRMLSPRSHVVKRYAARTQRSITDEDIAAFAAGVQSGGDRFAPARLWAEEEDGLAFVEVTEGKYHQVKRMFEATGNRVLQLTRVQIGGLALPEDLAPGQVRVLEQNEAARVFL